jgi:chorismate mutase-like protein
MPKYASQCNLAPISRLFELVASRSQYLESVAAYKYYNQQSVYDATQEQAVLTAVARYAKQLGLEEQSSLVFAQLQMDLAKQMEVQSIVSWQSGAQKVPPVATLPTLTQLRHDLRHHDSLLYSALAAAIPVLASCNQKQVQQAYTASFTRYGVGTSVAITRYQDLVLSAILQVKLAANVSNRDIKPQL